jgi:hypothetical protein
MNIAAPGIIRLITERTPVVALFVSKDERVRTRVQGFVDSFEPSIGLSISTPFSSRSRQTDICILDHKPRLSSRRNFSIQR